MKLYLYRLGHKTPFSALFQTSLDKEASLEHVKQTIAEKLPNLAEPKQKLLGGWSGGPSRIRLRDKKEPDHAPFLPTSSPKSQP